MNCKTVFAAAAALALGSSALGQESEERTKQDTKTTAANTIKPLHIGDPAPRVDLTHWVKGDKVTKFEPDKVYVLEFWATWCGPCRMSMPHLTKLQEQYKDYGVTFIGVSDEDLRTVTKFLGKVDQQDEAGKKWTDKMGYTVAADADQSAYESYMFGVGAGGIPTAFIIGKDTKIEWVGHPSEIDDPLSQVVKDTWDRKTFAMEFEPQAEENRKKQAPRLEERAKLRPYQLALINAKEKGDWGAAAKAYDDLIAQSKNPVNMKVQKFQMLLRDANMPDKAYPYGEEIAKENWDKPGVLNQLAWFVVDKEEDIQKRNYDFALKIANRAVEASESKDGLILDTLARVYFEKGDVSNAIKYQKMAVEVAPEQFKAELEKALAEYEAKK